MARVHDIASVPQIILMVDNSFLANLHVSIFLLSEIFTAEVMSGRSKGNLDSKVSHSNRKGCPSKARKVQPKKLISSHCPFSLQKRVALTNWLQL